MLILLVTELSIGCEEKKRPRFFALCDNVYLIQQTMNTSSLAQKILSKEDLKQLVSTTDASVTFSKQKQNHRTSEIWSYFSTVFVNNIKQDYVLCRAGQVRAFSSTSTEPLSTSMSTSTDPLSTSMSTSIDSLTTSMSTSTSTNTIV